MKKLTATLLGTVAAASLAIGLGPASAHATVTPTAKAPGQAMAKTKTYTLKQGKDKGWVKYYTKNGRRKVQIAVCDNEYDGNTVYGEFFNGSTIATKTDGNGQGGGCYKKSRYVNNKWIHWFKICEDDWFADTCTKKKYTDD